jgi:hypothetical protein
MLQRDKKLFEQDTELQNLRKSNDGFQKYKSERENLILENTKFDSEIKRLRFDLEEAKTYIERQNIIISNKEETISKMNQEMNYLTYNAKTSKQNADKSLQDALTYQQIVRKMEKEITESEHKREKVENELNIIKQQLFK